MQDQDHPKGSLKIGSMETTAAVRLPEILACYHKQFPLVELSLQTSPTKQLVEAILQFEMDAAFVSGPIVHTHLHAETVFREKMLLISSKELPNLELESATILVLEPDARIDSNLKDIYGMQELNLTG